MKRIDGIYQVQYAKVVHYKTEEPLGGFRVDPPAQLDLRPVEARWEGVNSIEIFRTGNAEIQDYAYDGAKA